MIQVYSHEAELKTAERKLYYKELVAFVREWLHNIPDGGNQALKQLFFEGMLNEPRASSMASAEPLLICLAAPQLDMAFARKVFSEYSTLFSCRTVNLFRQHFHGKQRPQWPEAVRRYWLVVEALGDDGCNWLREDYDYRYMYLRFYVTTFGGLVRGRGSDLYLGPALAQGLESDLQELFQLPEGKQELFVYFQEQLMGLLAGEAEEAQVIYRDPFLLDFLERFFSGRLPPYLQALVTEIYEGLEQRITWVNGQVRY